MRETRRIIKISALIILLIINTSLISLATFRLKRSNTTKKTVLPETYFSGKNTSIHTDTATTSNATKLDLGKLRNYVLNKLITEIGGFPLFTEGDGYINATYFGILTVYALGGMSEYTNRLKNWLNYSYDEEIYGFRDWIGNNASFTATLWGLLIFNFTGIKPTGFSFNSTIEYLNLTLRSISTDELDLISTSLLLKVLYLFHYRLSERYISSLIEALEEHLFNFYDQQIGFFYDPKVNIGEIIQTYFCISALSTANKSKISPTMAQNIANSLIKHQHIGQELDDMIGGFHSDNEEPNVFETGLATEMLVWFLKNKLLDEETATLISNDEFWSNVTLFVNKSQDADGGILSSPKSKIKSIFHAYGAISVYLSRNLLKEYTRISTNIKPSDQIAIDYNGTITTETEIEIMGEKMHNLTGFFTVQNTFNGDVYLGKVQEENSKYICNISTLINITFGRYYVNITLFRTIGLNNITFTSQASFRIGYSISVDISETFVKPSDNISLSIHVKFHNGSYVNNSIISIMLQHGSEKPLINRTRNLNASVLVENCTIPPNASLGKYILTLIINDTYGFNHTFRYVSIYVSDNVNYNIKYSKTEYYICENITISLHNLTYSSSQYPISTNANLTPSIVTIEGDILSTGNASWFYNGSFVNVNITLMAPKVIPNDINVTIQLEITWDDTADGTKLLSLLNATLKIERFYLSNVSFYEIKDNKTSLLEEPIFYIGETYNLSFYLVHIANISGPPHIRQHIHCKVENATIALNIKRTNKTWGKANITFDLDRKVYIGSFCIDPNMPPTNYTVEIQIFLDFNQTWINYTFPIFVQGTLRIVNSSFPYPAIKNHEYIADFSLICNETNKTLRKVKLFANVTYIIDEENTTIKIPITTHDDTYILLFDVKPAKYLLISLFRDSDNLNIANILVNIIEKKKPMEINWWFLVPISIVIAYIAYIFVRSIYSKKISRRYLIERSKKLF